MKQESEKMKICPNAKSTDQYHGWECKITGGECMFLFPNYNACQSMYEYNEKMEVNNEPVD